MKNVSSVVIVGRTNVGKSTLFNRMSARVKSITHDEEGVTRDFVRAVVTWKNASFELKDTGGISLQPSKDIILEHVRQQALELIKEADVVLLVVDGTVGIMPEDRDLSKMLHKLGKNVILVVNKADCKVTEANVPEFERLGHRAIMTVSAQHGAGCDELQDEIIAMLPKHKNVVEKAVEFKIVLLGKPNVGKSSLINQLLREERMIVTDQPGTTREAVSERIVFHKADIQITDTPGIRRKRGVTEPLEQMMTKSSFRAVENADIVLLLVDVSQGEISDQELKLAFYVLEKHKSLILLFNKYDLLEHDDYASQRLESSLEQYPQLTKRTVRLNISCKTGKNIGKIMPAVQEVWARYSQTIPSEEISALLVGAITAKPLYHKTMPLTVYKAKQVATAPLTIVMIVNQPQWFEESQLGFFENVMRKKYDLRGVPVRILTRKR
jgi:GTP-binding protein